MDRDLAEPPEPTPVEEARAKLFGFVMAGAEEDDLPTFAAALDDYARELTGNSTADIDGFLAQLHDQPYTRQMEWVMENYVLLRKDPQDDAWAPESGTS